MCYSIRQLNAISVIWYIWTDSLPVTLFWMRHRDTLFLRILNYTPGTTVHIRVIGMRYRAELLMQDMFASLSMKYLDIRTRATNTYFKCWKYPVTMMCLFLETRRRNTFCGIDSYLVSPSITNPEKINSHISHIMCICILDLVGFRSKKSRICLALTNTNMT